MNNNNAANVNAGAVATANAAGSSSYNNNNQPSIQYEAPQPVVQNNNQFLSNSDGYQSNDGGVNTGNAASSANAAAAANAGGVYQVPAKTQASNSGVYQFEPSYGSSSSINQGSFGSGVEIINENERKNNQGQQYYGSNNVNSGSTANANAASIANAGGNYNGNSNVIVPTGCNGGCQSLGYGSGLSFF